MRDSVKTYLALATGLSELSRERAVAAAEALVAQGEAAKDQVAALAEELMVSSKSNREAIAALVRTEVDRTVARLGVAKTDDVSALFRSVESALRDTAAKAADAVHELAMGMGLVDQTATPPQGGQAATHSPATATAAEPEAAEPVGKPAKTNVTKAASPAKAAKPAKAANPAKRASPAKPPKPAKAAKPAPPAKPAGSAGTDN